MASYFLDTSAIVKRYAPDEQGHTWVVTLCNLVQENKLYISQAALVEVVASMCRKARDQGRTATERDQLIAKFRRDIRTDYTLLQVTTTIYTSAGNLCRLYRLRAYDAVQLACVLRIRDKALTDRALEPIFVCADNQLLSIAITEGLSVENPNDYPRA